MTFKYKNITAFINLISGFSTRFFSTKIGLGILFFLVFQFSLAQKKQENMGTEVVNVVKPYTPTISDAFKVKETPSLDDEGTAKKEVVKYSIFSFPVASTFTPSKGKAEGLEKVKQEHLFANYASLGAGNYGTLNAELYVTDNLNNNEYIGGMFRHLSSQGGIDESELNDAFYDTSIDLIYGNNQKDLSWNIDLGYHNQIYNWYGLPDDFGNALAPVDRDILIDGINPQQIYNTISLGGKMDASEGVFNDASLKFDHFSDTYGSSENRFNFKPSFQFDVMDYSIKTDVFFDYLNGSFEKNYSNTNLESMQYGYANFGVAPSFVLQEDDWTLNIGAGFFYSLDTQNSNNKFFVYPQINATCKVVGDLMVFYAGAKGNLEQNTYLDFVAANPFVSPTLNSTPTDKQYDVFAGLKGKLANNVSYNIKGSLVSEKNKALFRSNDYTANSSNENYAFGNSFQIVYDDVKTVSFYAELKADFSENVIFGINGTFNSYTNGIQEEAWNLPSMKMGLSLDVNFAEKWNVGINAFYVGERKDLQVNNDIAYIAIAPFTPNPITLAGYFDLNAHLGFKYNERLTAFLRANNITNQAYEKWLNYPVQGFQLVIGANYKFDF